MPRRKAGLASYNPVGTKGLNRASSAALSPDGDVRPMATFARWSYRASFVSYKITIQILLADLSFHTFEFTFLLLRRKLKKSLSPANFSSSLLWGTTFDTSFQVQYVFLSFRKEKFGRPGGEISNLLISHVTDDSFFPHTA